MENHLLWESCCMVPLSFSFWCSLRRLRSHFLWLGVPRALASQSTHCDPEAASLQQPLPSGLPELSHRDLGEDGHSGEGTCVGAEDQVDLS